MGKRVRLTNDSLNSYGYRVLTSGIDLSLYEKNPVLLYMHQRGMVIGKMTDLEVGDGEITGIPVFDEASELSRQCRKQWEVGSLRMVSIGFDPIETSSEEALLVDGQTRPTVTKSRILEVSIVDIGSNGDAIVLGHDGEMITLGEGQDCPLPLLDNNHNKEPQMELKTLALQLGLPETADEASVNARLAELKASNEAAERIRKENEELKLAQITAAVDTAITDRKILPAKKEHFIKVGLKLGIEELQETLSSMSPRARLSELLEIEPEEKETLTKSPWDERMAQIRGQLNK
ncbi:MAG: HK97 family phage prohead protease [Muribaculaceae bacterium]|nr:HK97 family phage prohead protease [Muribaculaceae bacterium]